MIEILDEEFFFLNKQEQLKFLDNLFIKLEIKDKYKFYERIYDGSKRLKEFEYDMLIADCNNKSNDRYNSPIVYLSLKIRHGSIFIDESNNYKWYSNEYQEFCETYIRKYLIYLICRGFNLAEKENYNITFFDFIGSRIFNRLKYEKEFNIKYLDFNLLEKNVPDSFSKLSLFKKNFKKAQLLL